MDGLNVRVVTLCGSFRFLREMEALRQVLEQDGVECLIAAVLDAPDPDPARLPAG